MFDNAVEVAEGELVTAHTQYGRTAVLGRFGHGVEVGVGVRLCLDGLPGMLQVLRTDGGVVIALIVVQLLAVLQHDLGRRSGHAHGAVTKQDGMVRERTDRLLIVRHQQQRAAVGTQRLHLLETALLEKCIAHRQRFVDDEDVRLHLSLHCERQSQHHAAGVSPHRLVNEVADVGEGGDGIEALHHLALGETQDHAVENDVLTPGEVRIEAAAQFQQRGDTAIDPRRASGGGQRAGDDLQ
ncbi:hypothetical protein D3C81_1079440 [compost metagenome]